MPNISNKLHLFILVSILTLPASAGDLSGSGYIIKMGTINIVSGTVENSTYKPSTTGSGFQYSRDSEPFSLTLNTDSINLGTVIANTFAKTNATLTVTGAGVHGYTVKAIENHPLQIGESPSTIPDTVCDPKEKCTANHAAPWTSTSSYGFGYSLDQTNFQPFANNSLNQVPVALMSNPKSTAKDTANLTFQANISPTQGDGLYENSIQFIALPSY